MRRDLPLSRQILLVQFAIVLATLGFGAVASRMPSASGCRAADGSGSSKASRTDGSAATDSATAFACAP